MNLNHVSRFLAKGGIVLGRKTGNSYEDEIEDMLQKVAEDLPDWEEISWFLQLAESRLCDFSSGRKKVFVLGTSLPDVLFRSFGISPVRLMGGSRRMAEVSDSSLPRDADPVIRAAYGFLSRVNDNKSLVVIPLVNDNYRKVAYLLKRSGINVYTAAVPPVKNEAALAEWVRQMELLAERLSVYSGRGYSERRLKKAGRETAKAKRQLSIFDALAGTHQSEISSIFRMFLPFCYYLADDFVIWQKQLQVLNKRLSGIKENPGKDVIEILLMGSPVYFPNYKVPLLLQEAGISFGGNFLISDIRNPYDGTGGFDAMCRESFVNDGSPSYVKNDTLFVRTSEYLKKHQVRGVVYHVLKGQIEYDFEMERFEHLFAKYDIPMIRLETDYSNQDVEQLRIRIEAFSEMLRERRK